MSYYHHKMKQIEESVTMTGKQQDRSPFWVGSIRQPPLGALERLHRLFETLPTEDAEHPQEYDHSKSVLSLRERLFSYGSSGHKGGY